MSNVAPWPCFMMVAGPNLLSKNGTTIKLLGRASIQAALEVNNAESTPNHIAKMYNLDLDEVEQWYSSVEWQTSTWLSSKMLNNVTQTLHRIGLIKSQKIDNFFQFSAKIPQIVRFSVISTIKKQNKF